MQEHFSKELDSHPPAVRVGIEMAFAATPSSADERRLMAETLRNPEMIPERPYRRGWRIERRNGLWLGGALAAATVLAIGIVTRGSTSSEPDAPGRTYTTGPAQLASISL